MTWVIPGAGAVHVTIVALCCLQVRGGSRPLAPPLWLARIIAAIKALGGFGVPDADEAALFCGFDPDRPLTRAQVPAPAASRNRAVRAAIQPGRANQRRRLPDRPGGG